MKNIIGFILGLIVLAAIAIKVVPEKFPELLKLKESATQMAQEKAKQLEESIKDSEVAKEEQDQEQEESPVIEEKIIEDKVVKKDSILREKILNLNGDDLEDQAILEKSEAGLVLSVYAGSEKKGFEKISDSKALSWDGDKKSIHLLKEHFPKADTLVVLRKSEDGRSKLKIVLRKGKLVVGGYSHKDKELSCDINFLNKQAIVDEQGINHKEKIEDLASWQEEKGLELCLQMQESLPSKEEVNQVSVVEEKKAEPMVEEEKKEDPAAMVEEVKKQEPVPAAEPSVPEDTLEQELDKL